MTTPTMRALAAAAVAVLAFTAPANAGAKKEPVCKPVPIAEDALKQKLAAYAGLPVMSAEQIHCAAAVIRARGYACSNVNFAVASGTSREVELRCNEHYRYIVADKGGNAVVTLKE